VILVALLLLLGGVALWNFLAGVAWMGWICVGAAVLCVLHVIEWAVKDL
jgi:hypothetical protein